MWALYEEYAPGTRVAEQFNPTHEWEIRQPPPLPPPAVPTPLSLSIIEEVPLFEKQLTNLTYS